MYTKINQLLSSAQPPNILLAYQLLKVLYHLSPVDSVHYIIIYFLNQNKQEKTVLIDFGVEYCQIRLSVEQQYYDDCCPILFCYAIYQDGMTLDASDLEIVYEPFARDISIADFDANSLKEELDYFKEYHEASIVKYLEHGKQLVTVL